MALKRFLLFAAPHLTDHVGGWNEFIDSFATLDEAREAFGRWLEKVTE